jgi:hypothetical protein
MTRVLGAIGMRLGARAKALGKLLLVAYSAQVGGLVNWAGDVHKD